LKKPLYITVICLCLLLIALINSPLLKAANEDSWKIVSWSAPVGPQALTYETLKGLKAMISFINANGGVNGRTIDLYTLETDDSSQDFPASLNSLVIKLQPSLAVGGASNTRPEEIAEFFRRTDIVWFGPWANNDEMYQMRNDDPVGLFPSGINEIDLLFSFAAKRLGQGGVISFIYYEAFESLSEIQKIAAAAEKHQLTFQPKALPTDFRHWASLEEELSGAGAAVLWLPPGPAAAIVRTLKVRLPKNMLWMTSSLNFPGYGLMELTGGRWKGMIFPSILSDDNSMNELYNFVLSKYGPKGLTYDYQSYLGLAQGQILVRALIDVPYDKPKKNQNIRDNFKVIGTQGTMFQFPSFKTGGPPEPSSAFLAEATENSLWRAIE
jgi:ABC-type branched-subunit amino acid transport system substrate-binding protein